MEESLLGEIKILESKYLFLKKEHATLIKGLHEEIEKLQRKYSEVAFDQTMRADKSSEIILLEHRIMQLQVSVKEKNEELQSQNDYWESICKRHQEEESKLLARIEEQNKKIEDLQEILRKNVESTKNIPGQLEKGDRAKEEAHTEKIHKRKKKKSANSFVDGSITTSIVPDNSSEISSILMAEKSSKSASFSANPPLKTIENSPSENNYNRKKGRKEGHKRGRKKSSLNSPLDDILPSDYRSVVATLPPIVRTHEEPHKSHVSYSSAVNSHTDPITISQLHKGLRNSFKS